METQIQENPEKEELEKTKTAETIEVEEEEEDVQRTSSLAIKILKWAVPLIALITTFVFLMKYFF